MKQVKVLQLINAYRFRGHQHANLDPLGLWKQERVADLDPSFHDLTEADFGKPSMSAPLPAAKRR